MSEKLISLLVPVFNEEANVVPFYTTLSSLLTPLAGTYSAEFIFTDNHSTDKTWPLLKELALADKRVKAIRFSRNFGYQKSIYTGYLNAKGDAAIQIDCDFQDPPELILAFLAKWRAGYKVVYGIRESRKESFLMNLPRKMFYRLINFLSEDDLPLDAGDFRLVDRIIIDELKKVHDEQPYIRGMISSFGFAQTGLEYARNSRRSGTSKFDLRSYFRLATDGILNHSIVPLRIASYVGITVSILTLGCIVVYACGKFLYNKTWPAGFATTTVLILFSISLNGIFLGIIGEYIGRIYINVKKKPLTIIEEQFNL
jgi:dolichol-phosphate mannosyltransferase